MSDQPIVIQLPTALEAQPLLRCLKLPKAEAGANDPPTWRGDHAGRAVSVVLSGVMRQRAADAAEWVVRHLQPAEVVLAGVAGGLDPTLRIADVVQPARVVDAMGGAAFRPTDYDAASGTLITIDEVARLPDQKAALREQHGADAVDMETAAAARVCVSHHVPWRCVRTISDDARTELPPGLMKLIDADGRIQWRTTIGVLAQQPRRIGSLIVLARAMRRATTALAGALVEMIEQE